METGDFGQHILSKNRITMAIKWLQQKSLEDIFLCYNQIIVLTYHHEIHHLSLKTSFLASFNLAFIFFIPIYFFRFFPLSLGFLLLVFLFSSFIYLFICYLCLLTDLHLYRMSKVSFILVRIFHYRLNPTSKEPQIENRKFLKKKLLTVHTI